MHLSKASGQLQRAIRLHPCRKDGHGNFLIPSNDLLSSLKKSIYPPTLFFSSLVSSSTDVVAYSKQIARELINIQNYKVGTYQHTQFVEAKRSLDVLRREKDEECVNTALNLLERLATELSSNRRIKQLPWLHDPVYLSPLLNSWREAFKSGQNVLPPDQLKDMIQNLSNKGHINVNIAGIDIHWRHELLDAVSNRKSESAKIDALVSSMSKSKDASKDIVSYNIVLRYYANKKLIDKVEEVLVEIQKNELKLDMISQSTLVFAYCGSGMHDRAIQAIHEMLLYYNPDLARHRNLIAESTQNILVALRKQVKLDKSALYKAKDLFDKLKERDIIKNKIESPI